MAIDQDARGRILLHSGWYPGYHSQAAHWPDLDLTLALQINRDHDSQLREIHAALADLLTEWIRNGKEDDIRDAA